MEIERCRECEASLIVAERPTGEKFLLCQFCGTSLSNQEQENELVHNLEGEPSAFCFFGQGSKPEAYKYEKHRVSSVKKRAKGCLDMLCEQFKTPVRLKKDIESIMEQAKLQRQHKAVTGAIFLAYLREQQEQDGSTNKPTLRQVSNILDIPMKKIGAAMKQLQGLLAANNCSMGSGAITNVSGLIRNVLPSVTLRDPLIPEVDITERVLSLTEKIITLVQRRTTRSIEPNLITIAAHFLAWQSCFYYQKAHHSHVTMDILRKPGNLPTLEGHLELLKIDRSILLSIQRCYSYIVNELAALLEKMPWVVKKKKVVLRQQVPEHLETILDFQEVTCDVLTEEAEIKRQNEVHIQPVIPRELTAEEEAALDVPELSEKDLPDSELRRYIKTAKEVDSLMQLIETRASDSAKQICAPPSSCSAN